MDDTDAQLVLRRLNSWIDSLALERMVASFVVRTVRALASGTASYTIGTGGVINIARPDTILAANLIIDSAVSPVSEIEIEIFTDQAWQAIQQKALAGSLPRGIYYDRGWQAGHGLIYPWPVPDVNSTSLVLYTEQAVAQFVDLTTDYTFPPGYDLFLRTNLLEQIAPAFKKELTQDQAKVARDARAKLKRSNIRPVEAILDPRTPGAHYGHWDWRVG